MLDDSLLLTTVSIRAGNLSYDGPSASCTLGSKRTFAAPSSKVSEGLIPRAFLNYAPPRPLINHPNLKFAPTLYRRLSAAKQHPIFPIYPSS